MGYSQPLDIANSVATMLGQDQLTLNDFNGNPFATKLGRQVNANYDKMRLVEIQRNLWKFSTRRVILRPIGIDSVLWTPSAWTAGNYPVGSVVSYTPTVGPYTGVTSYWRLNVAEPSSVATPDIDPNWQHYCGPLALDLYNTGAQGQGSTTAYNDSEIYQAGEVVLVPATYGSGTAYSINQVVNYNGAWYVSLTNANTGNTPSSSPTDWVLWTSQGRGQGTYGITATKSPIPLTYPGAYSIYLSLYNNNSDNPVNGTGNWVNVGGTVVPLIVVWPADCGPYNDPTTNNAFHLPSAFLKRAPTDPKAGQTGYLGANSGSNPEDWVIEGRLIVTGDAGPIMVRFIADITDVNEFDPMFCEGLACRIALKNNEVITQKPDLKKDIMEDYKKFMGEARATNSIEQGIITPVENRYVTVRA
jgi:hypothetical protein